MSVAKSKTGRFEVMLPDTELYSVARRVQESSPPGEFKPLRILSKWTEINARAKRDLFIVIFRSTLLNDTEFDRARRSHTAGEKRFVVLPDSSPPEALLERVLRLNVRTPRRIHTPRLEVDKPRTFVSRFLYALALSGEEKAITDAWWEEDKLVILSPTLERLKVPLSSIPKIRNARREQMESFDIDKYGKFIYWRSHRVHMGWSQFEQGFDPQAKIRSRQQSKAFNKEYGRAVSSLRRQSGLRQSDITGLDARTVRRIEQGGARATANALGKLAAAHGMETHKYMSALAEKLGASG